MATRGRKPKPTAIRELEGVPGHRPLNENEPKPPKSEKATPPSWLHRYAKAEWKRVYPILDNMDVITEADMAAFLGYCQCYARWREAEEYIAANGATFETDKGYIQQRPQVAIASQNLKQMQAFATEFGMTPASRTRLSVGGGKTKVMDEMAALLSGEF